MKTLIAALALAALCVGCSKEDPTATPTPPADAATPTTATPSADDAAAAKEADELAKEIEADLADEG